MALMVTGGFRTLDSMETALRTNALDVIGFGRPFCVEPVEVIRGLLDGSTTELEDVTVTTGVKLLDAGVSSIWHAAQIKRMAEGKRDAEIMLILKGLEPDKKLGVAWFALVSPLQIYFSDSCTII
jgi:hypothetical protein